jgi:O-antigen/teichoic acid export membrane protein
MSELARKAGNAVRWVFVTNTIVQFFNFLVSVSLARILVPEDYGKVSLALVFINAFGIFKDMGLSQALIYRKEDVHRAANVAFTINMAVGLGLYLVILAVSPLVDVIFKTQGLWAVASVLGASVLITSGGLIPAALLDKELQFRKKFLAEVLPVAMYAAISLPMAIKGYGVWSLVAGSLASAFANTGMLWWISRWRPSFRWDWTIAREMLTYGQHLFYTSIFIFLAANLDRFLLGKLVTLKDVGVYTLAFTIGNLPSTQITGVAGKVLFPTYAKIGSDIKKLAEVYALTFRIIAMVSIPAALGLMAVSSNLMSVLYGSKWQACVVPIIILSGVGLLRSVGAIANNVYLALGKSHLMPKMMIVQIVVSLISMLLLGLRFGVNGVAIGFVIAMLVTVWWGIAIIVRLLPLRWMDILGYPMLYVLGGCLMVVVVVLAESWLPTGIVGLVMQIVLGAITYSAISLLLARKRLLADWRLVKNTVLK